MFVVVILTYLPSEERGANNDHLGNVCFREARSVRGPARLSGDDTRYYRL